MSVIVTVAPGAHFTVPHPSGLQGMRPLTVSGGDRVRVSQLRADDLWNARLILHPVTGVRPAPYVAESVGVKIDGAGAPGTMWNGLGIPPRAPEPPSLMLPETTASDPSRVARRRLAVGSGFPRALVDVTFENAMRDPVEINQEATDLPWPI